MAVSNIRSSQLQQSSPKNSPEDEKHIATAIALAEALKNDDENDSEHLKDWEGFCSANLLTNQQGRKFGKIVASIRASAEEVLAYLWNVNARCRETRGSEESTEVVEDGRARFVRHSFKDR